MIIIHIEYAPEVAALDQPNSDSIGWRKTPKVNLVPCINIRMIKGIITMI